MLIPCWCERRTWIDSGDVNGWLRVPEPDGKGGLGKPRGGSERQVKVASWQQGAAVVCY